MNEKYWQHEYLTVVEVVIPKLKKELISEFVNDLEIIDDIDWDKYFWKFNEIKKKWEEKLK